MYDRPTASELLDAARMHLEQQVIPAVRADPKLYFQTLVAINVLKIVGREIALGDSHAAAEWAGLNMLEGKAIELPTPLSTLNTALASRNQALCAAIRAGDYDEPQKKAALFSHLMMTTAAQLEVANPKFLQTVMGGS
jgi:hypothetical protein